jgi:hypothetical protein
MVARHVWGSRLAGCAACGLASLGNCLTRQAGKLVRALQADAQSIGIVWNNRHGHLSSSSLSDLTENRSEIEINMHFLGNKLEFYYVLPGYLN